LPIFKARSKPLRRCTTRAKPNLRSFYHEEGNLEPQCAQVGPERTLRDPRPLNVRNLLLVRQAQCQLRSTREGQAWWGDTAQDGGVKVLTKYLAHRHLPAAADGLIEASRFGVGGARSAIGRHVKDRAREGRGAGSGAGSGVGRGGRRVGRRGGRELEGVCLETQALRRMGT